MWVLICLTPELVLVPDGLTPPSLGHSVPVYKVRDWARWPPRPHQGLLASGCKILFPNLFLPQEEGSSVGGLVLPLRGLPSPGSRAVTLEGSPQEGLFQLVTCPPLP